MTVATSALTCPTLRHAAKKISSTDLDVTSPVKLLGGVQMTVTLVFSSLWLCEMAFAVPCIQIINMNVV
jgi:hypothetical protein